MIKYNNGMPVYWRDETSGRMLTAVMAFWLPYADSPNNVPELSEEHIIYLKQYLVHWAEAPCYRTNPYATAEHKMQLDSAIALCKSIESRKDINVALDALMELAIDPF